jgi:hypothetical protein
LLLLCAFLEDGLEAHFEKETQELLDKLAKAEIKTKGKVFTMLYNPPFIPGFLRRNEVAVEVEDPSAPLI